MPEAISKSGLTIEQILEDIKKEKKIENDVMDMHGKNFSADFIAKELNLKPSKVKHIVKFDKRGLTYRKVGKR